MAFAFVNHASVTGVSSPATTTGINTTGCTLIVVGIKSVSAAATLSDSFGNTWTGLTDQTVGLLHTKLFYCINPTVGAGHTFTGTNAGDQPGVFVSTYSGATQGFDVSAGTAVVMPGGSSAANFQPGSVTPTNANSLIVSFVGTVNAGFGAPLSTIDSGFTTTDVVTAIGGMAYLIQTSIVAENPNWATLNDSQDIGGTNAVFFLSAISLTCPVGGGTGTQGVFYSATLVASGGTPPYSFAIISGALPTGLSLNTATGVISGIPTSPGVFTYGAKVTDSASNTATVTCTITISAAPGALYDDNFSSYALSQAPPYGNLGLYFGSFPTAIEDVPTGPYGDPQCVDYYIPSARLKYPAATLSPSLTFYQQFSVFFAYRVQSNVADLQATPLNFLSAFNEVSANPELLVLRIEQDGTISFVANPSSTTPFANSGSFSLLANNWYYFQVNVYWTTNGSGHVIATAQVAVDEVLVLSATYDTGVLASSLAGTYVNGIVISGGGAASQLGRLTIFPSIHAIGADPHPGTPLARVSQGVIEIPVEPTTANVRVSQGVIELILQDTNLLTIACPVGGGTATVGVPYSAALVASAGTPPYTFALISGSFPPVLSLNPATGVISGTPTLPGTYVYEAKVTDSVGGTATATCEIVVPGVPPPPFCIVPPNPSPTSSLSAYTEPTEPQGS